MPYYVLKRIKPVFSAEIRYKGNERTVGFVCKFSVCFGMTAFNAYSIRVAIVGAVCYLVKRYQLKHLALKPDKKMTACPRFAAYGKTVEVASVLRGSSSGIGYIMHYDAVYLGEVSSRP